MCRQLTFTKETNDPVLKSIDGLQSQSTVAKQIAFDTQYPTAQQSNPTNYPSSLGIFDDLVPDASSLDASMAAYKQVFINSNEDFDLNLNIKLEDTGLYECNGTALILNLFFL